jgi:hypothetical protein
MQHGLSGYTNRHCRCDVCLTAHRCWRKAWVAKQRENGLCLLCLAHADHGAYCGRHRRMRTKSELARRARRKQEQIA